MLDLAAIRLRNTRALFAEFVRSTVAVHAAGDVKGLDRLFAEHLAIAPSYWSQLKSGERQIGEKLARQFESLAGKPAGWLDAVQQAARAAAAPAPEPSLPVNADERFAVGLFLTAYRLNPQAVKQRLLATLDAEMLKARPAPRR
ncbi:MAG: hypothetical protein ACK5TK_13275 [Betaproteobacteria bacterium]